MKSTTALFKIGGKILENTANINSTITQLIQLKKQKIFQKIIIVTGGGFVANFVRKVYNELEITEELAHWMGIISMCYNGIELGKKFSNLKIIEDFEALERLEKNITIFLPFKYLKEKDKLPHSWDVTSDSIALFMAKELGLDKCFLIKDIEGILDKQNQVIKEISVNNYRKFRESDCLADVEKDENYLKSQTKPIDPYLITLIDTYKIPCVILNGTSNYQRILEFFDVSKSSKAKIFSIIR